MPLCRRGKSFAFVAFTMIQITKANSKQNIQSIESILYYNFNPFSLKFLSLDISECLNRLFIFKFIHIFSDHLSNSNSILSFLFKSFQIITSETIHNEIHDANVPSQKQQSITKICHSHSSCLRSKFRIKFVVVFKLFSSWVRCSSLWCDSIIELVFMESE